VNDPLVSVIIRTCFSRRGCLQKAINSIINQTYKSIELVVVENGSDELKEWLSAFDFPAFCKVSYYHLDEANRCIAGNLGMSQAKGSLLCFLDDDDEFYSNHLNLLANALKRNRNASAAYSKAHELPSSIESYTPFICKDGKPRVVFGRKFSRGAIFVNNYIPIQSILFKKNLFKDNGGFDLSLDNLEDWNLWTRYASQDDFVYVPEVTSFYRVPNKISDMRARDEKLDVFYPLARKKQSDIKVKLNFCLLTEVVEEIIQSQMLSNKILSKFFLPSIKKVDAYKAFCEHQGVDLSRESIESTVLEVIELANSVVREFTFLWLILRIENYLKKKLCLSQIKRLVK